MKSYGSLNSLLNYSNNGTNVQSWFAPSTYNRNPARIITSDIVDLYKELYTNNKDKRLKSNTTVYITPLVNLPLYKFRNYIKENKLNITTARKIDKLDSMVISDSLIREFYINEKSSKFYVIPNKLLIQLTPNINPHHLNILSEHKEFLIKHELLEEIKSTLPKVYDTLKANAVIIEGIFIQTGWGNSKAFNNVDTFFKIIKYYKDYELDIIFDHYINDEINVGTILDDEMFVSILNMLKSTDSDNLRISQEIIANCEFEVSKPYILFLLWAFKDFSKNNNNNKNFNFVIETLKSYRSIYNETRLENFLSTIIKKHPKYVQSMFKCLAMYLNTISKSNIIKEVTVS